MKRLSFAILVACIAFSLSACKTTRISSEPSDITESFFAAFESSDYENMKNYCTAKCIETYFHDGDVDGMVWAKLTELGEEEISDDRIVHVFVTVEMETAETSALYPGTETSFYVEFLRSDDNAWLINGFPTGR